MSELTEILSDKCKQEQAKAIRSLQERLLSVQSECNRRGMLNSSIYVQLTLKECGAAYREAVDAAKSEVTWALSQRAYVTESAATELSAVCVSNLSKMEAHCREQITRAAKRMSGSVLVEQISKEFDVIVAEGLGELSLHVRQWRAGHQRGALRFVLSAMVAPIRKWLGI